jgi:hypothetical protein
MGSEKNKTPLPEPQGVIVLERPNRLFYHSEECLLDEGWTKAAIAKFLPAVPDLIGPSPFGEPGDPPVNYWLGRRVKQIQLTNKDYQAWRLRVDMACANAKERQRAIERKRRRNELGLPDF